MTEVALPLYTLVGVWLYSVFVPPPPRLKGYLESTCGFLPRITLRDGRHLAYEEYGFPKDMAKFKIILFMDIAQINGILFPQHRVGLKKFKHILWDLINRGLGPKFYVIGYSSGGSITWGCLKYIPHRLEGAIMMAPGISFWWPSLPKDLVEASFEKQEPMQQFA
ncbi:hypothetical protein Leryth_018943 [Lithospermum erythrorhizon]|nr:hypothetical protein Leryth_018943 [Lithospermum erythrorhizon]